MQHPQNEIDNSCAGSGWRFLAKNDPAENGRSKKSNWFFIELIAGFVTMLFK